ncbi:hypothetical protein DENSPDRAFT_301150 [Dentipellis sp. KUC8613]|nr:hypothetical protein DENSPDRAFT_301150 [Dentipellis sp. KUC8613]
MQPVHTRVSPLRRLAQHSTSSCGAQASAYGKCMFASYTDVHKDICKAEFDKFAVCLRQAVCHVHLLSIPCTDLP